MSLVRSLLKLLFFHIPRSLFQIAGLVRIVRRGRRAFRKSLKAGGLPKEVVDALMKEFDPFEGVGLRGLLGSRGIKRKSSHGKTKGIDID